MKHWADRVDWWRVLGALTAVVGSGLFLNERVARLDEREVSNSTGDVQREAQLRADMRELRSALNNCDCGRAR